MAGSFPEMPCGPILELQGQRKRFHVPYGLKPLLDLLIRKVLKDQPDNLYDYLACVMEERVKEKEEAEAKEKAKEAEENEKSWNKHRWSWEASSLLSDESLLEFLQTLRTSQDDADHYATVIQAAYRGHLVREKVKEIRHSRDLGAAAGKQHDDGSVEENAERNDDEHLGETELDLDQEEEETDESEESEEEDSDYYDNEDDNFAGDEYEDYTHSYEKESEEEFETETEAETVSELGDLADEAAEVVTKSPAAFSKYDLDKDEGEDEDEEG